MKLSHLVIALTLTATQFCVSNQSFAETKDVKLICRGAGGALATSMSKSLVKALLAQLPAGARVRAGVTLKDSEDHQTTTLPATQFDGAWTFQVTQVVEPGSVSTGQNKISLTGFDDSKIPALTPCSIKKTLVVSGNYTVAGKRAVNQFKFTKENIIINGVMLPFGSASKNEHSNTDGSTKGSTTGGGTNTGKK